MSEKGFTLIEILIVVLIVGLLALAVVLRGGSQHNESAKVVTDRLRSIFIYAEQQAILHPATLGFDYNKKTGYQFFSYYQDPDSNSKKASWEVLSSDTILRNYVLPAKITLDITPAEIHPAIIFFPNGEISAFKINILEDHKVIYQIIGEANGDIQAIKNPR